MPLDLPVKVRPWELAVYPRSHLRRRFGVTRIGASSNVNVLQRRASQLAGRNVKCSMQPRKDQSGRRSLNNRAKANPGGEATATRTVRGTGVREAAREPSPSESSGAPLDSHLKPWSLGEAAPAANP